MKRSIKNGKKQLIIKHKITKEFIIEIEYKNTSEINLSGKDLSDADLSDANLSIVDLWNANNIKANIGNWGSIMELNQCENCYSIIDGSDGFEAYEHSCENCNDKELCADCNFCSVECEEEFEK